MKKKSWLFVVYCTMIIVSLAVFLVVYPKHKAKDTLAPKDETKSVETNSQQTEEVDNNIYLKSITVNCSTDFIVPKGSRCSFDQDFISVKPDNQTVGLEFKFLNSHDEIIHDLIFLNYGFDAIKVGNYKLQISGKSSKSAYIKKYINITIVEVEDFEYITQKKDKLDLFSNINFSSVFETDLQKEIEVATTGSALSYDNGVFQANSVGKANVNLTIRYTNFICEMVYEIVVVPLNYSIDAKDSYTYNFVLNINKSIPYYVSRGEDFGISQEIEYTVADESVIKVVSSNQNIIVIKLLKIGTTTLTLKSTADSTATKTITIVVQ